MNEKLNLVKILKDCPKGTKLYSTVFGEVEFESIKDIIGIIGPIVVTTNIGDSECFTSDGKMFARYNGECVLFPSKEQRDWSKFKIKKPKFYPKTFQPFDKVLVYDIYDICEGWACALFSHIRESEYPYSTSSGSFKVCIPYNDDTKHLLGTTDEAPEFYRYWED